MARVTIDFGSSNSGACINPYDDDYNATRLKFIHNDTTNEVAKQPTEFWIKRGLMQCSMDEIITQMRVLSCVQNETENFNVVWTRPKIRQEISHLKEDNDWISFRRFKMHLYERESVVRARDGLDYALEKVIAVFLRIIISDSLVACKEILGDINYKEEEIEWGITVPAIWNPEQIAIMRRIVDQNIKGDSVLLREPECALIGIALNNKKELDWKDGRVTLVVDAGGGTTDLAYMVEEKDSDDSWHFRHLTQVNGRAKGGNDIDNLFWQLFAKRLVEISGEDISMPPAQDLWNGLIDNPTCRMDMEDVWTRLKHTLSDNNYNDTFGAIPEYRNWLSNKGHTQIVSAMDKYWGVPISADLIRENCFEPVLSKIKDAVEEMLEKKETPVRLRLAFAGGLSSYKPLRDMVTTIVQDKLGVENVEVMLNSAANTDEGALQGAIMYGGTYILTRGSDLVRRIARKTFLTRFGAEYEGYTNEDAFWQYLKNRIAMEYRNLGVDLNKALNMTSESFEKYRLYKSLKPYSNGLMGLYLSPLCLEGKSAHGKRTIPIFPIDKESHSVVVNIYSTHETVIPFPMDESSVLNHECKLEYNFGHPWESGYIEIDFNQSELGKITFRVLDKDRSVVAEDYVTGGTRRGL